jgi:biopolymer transport protein TolR
MPEINVTPLVDVSWFVIVFMVAAPLMTVGVPIELPNGSQQMTTSVEPLTITVQADKTARRKPDTA